MYCIVCSQLVVQCICDYVLCNMYCVLNSVIQCVCMCYVDLSVSVRHADLAMLGIT